MMLRSMFIVTFVFTAAAADLELVLLHTNDMHSRFDESDTYGNECHEDDASLGKCYGGFARVAQVVREEKQKAHDNGVSSLFVVAGDTFQGTPYYTFFQWKPVLDFINELRPDVMTLGNHEFDGGINGLVPYLDGLQKHNISTIVSNLNMITEPKLNALVSPSMVLTINNTRVGIVGYLTTDTPNISNTGTIEFLDEVESLKKETKKLRDDGVNIIIGLGHSGIEKDQIIAKEVEDIDLIVGGHSHTFLYSGDPPSIEIPYGPYPLYVTNNKNKTVPILQVYANTKYIGKVDLRFNSNGDLVSINGSPILLNHKVKKDLSMLKILDTWKSNVTSITNEVIGRTAVELINKCHVEECNIGNLIADSLVYYNVMVKNIYNEYWTDAPIGIVQAGGIRSSINETGHDGYITLGQLINVTPFANFLVKVTITGSTLLEVFENSVFGYDSKHGGGKLLQVSGVLVEYDVTKSPGHRVSSLQLRCGDCSVPKYEPLVLTANYTIITNRYLAEGGDSYKAVRKTVKKNEYIDVVDYNATVTYMKSINPIITGIEGRIKFISNHEVKTNASNRHTMNIQLLLIAFSTLLILTSKF